MSRFADKPMNMRVYVVTWEDRRTYPNYGIDSVWQEHGDALKHKQAMEKEKDGASYDIIETWAMAKVERARETGIER